MNRKDIIKKSLGITEYPWSSDDELEEVVPAETSSRRTADSRHSVADTSGTSGLTPQASQHQQPHQSALRRNQDRADRELFWSLINSPHRGVVSTVPLSNRQRSTEFPSYLSRVSHTPVAELRERGDRSTTGDIRSRIIAFRRLSRNVGSLGHGRCVSGLVPISRVNPGVVVPSEATSSIRINRTVPHRRYYRSTPSASCSSRTNVPSSPHISRPRREHETSSSRAPVQLLDHDETPLPAISRQNTNISDEGNPEPEETFEGEGEVASAETSGETLSLEEGAASQAGAEGAGPGAQLPAPQDPADGRFTTEFHRTKTDPNLSSVSQTAEAEAPPQQSTSHGVKRKRRDSDESTEPFTVQEFNQNLLRLLECPVCLEWMEPPMSQCRRGHLVCGRCRERLNCCPVCRTAFSSVRNRAMEGVAEMLRYPCRHGCGREVRLRRRAPHEASCAARNYLCPAPLCADSQPLPRAKLHQHFQSPKRVPGGLPRVEERSPSERDGTDDEEILLCPEPEVMVTLSHRLLRGSNGGMDALDQSMFLLRPLACLKLKQFTPGLPGGRPPPENEHSRPASQPLGPGRPYLEALRRLAVNIAEEEQNERQAGPNQQNVPPNPGNPPYFPAQAGHGMIPPLGIPYLPPPNAGPHYFLGIPDMPLPFGVQHNPSLVRPNIPPNGVQHHQIAQQVHDIFHHQIGGANGGQSKHLPMIKIGRRHKFSMKVNLEQHDNWLIFAMDEYFHLRIDVDIRTWGVIVYVSYIGPKCDAKNYTYSVTVDGQHNSRKISYARSTHSDLESSSLNVTRQDCFHLTLDQALNFIRFKNRHCDADKFLDFNVEIAKVEPTVPRDESDS